ncbi:MAG TPA: metallophosphatase [Candidatus Hydrogenedentes bacterium]|nr:metallophosphatase [Candidatus Hydrogenedentota bacterium]
MALIVLAAILAQVLAARKAKEREPFSIIVLPDTQKYSRQHPEIFVEQTKWIKEQRDAFNIACVIHEGDITDHHTEKEWEVADEAMGILDGIVPYAMVLGNHDLGPEGTLFNKYFGPERFENEPWYGGHFEDGNENAFYLIRAGGMDFLILCLEFGPRDEVLEWANTLVAEHKHRRIIVVTHCYMYSDDTRVGEGDEWNPHGYGRENDGEEMWQKFVKKHKNIFLVLSGHILNDGLGRLTSTGDKENKVHQILANYQMQENGGNGWLRIMTFLPTENKIDITTYSPVLKEYASDDQNQFQVEYSMGRGGFFDCRSTGRTCQETAALF